MTLLLCVLVLFIATHSVRLLAEPLRTALVQRWGLWPYKGVVSLVSLLGFWLLLTGYAQARLEPALVWTPPVFLRHITWLLMLVSLIFLVAAYVPRNHLKIKLKHPMVLSVKVWALSHLLVNGQLHQMVLFGSLLVWAVFSFKAARQRDAHASHTHADETVADPTPDLAMADVAQASSAHGLATLITLILGAAAWAALLWHFHAAWFGVSPLGALAA